MAARSGEEHGSRPSLTTGSPDHNPSVLQQNNHPDISPHQPVRQVCETLFVDGRRGFQPYNQVVQKELTKVYPKRQVRLLNKG